MDLMRRIFIFIVLLLGLLGLVVTFFYDHLHNQKQATSPTAATALKGMSSGPNAKNIYANAGVNQFANAVRGALPRVYVPNSLSNTVSVIDPHLYQVLTTFKTGKRPEHVVPSYDLTTLWVVSDAGNSLTPINPYTAKPGPPVPVKDPYNLYFTPDGRFAIVVCEGYKRLEFRDPKTMELRDVVPLQCKGANHMDFTADGRYAIATCEFSGQLFKLDVTTHQVLGYLSLGLNHSNMHSMPQDIRAAPDGRTFYVADMMLNGVFLIDPITFQQIGFIPTGPGTHSIYPSRDGQLLYIANRGCSKLRCHKHPPGSVTVLDPKTQKIVATWTIPGGGSPDMGNVSADGKELWLSGRYDGEVYVFDTISGLLTHRIAVGREPHGLTIWPQPGRYSLGHTGNMR